MNRNSENRFAISIHALREEGDDYMGIPTKVSKGISIHALREEGDEGNNKPKE